MYLIILIFFKAGFRSQLQLQSRTGTCSPWYFASEGSEGVWVNCWSLEHVLNNIPAYHCIQFSLRHKLLWSWKNPAVAAWTALCPSLFADLTLATSGLLSSPTVSTTVFLAASVVEARATERCFIRLDLVIMDVDKHFALGYNVHNVHVCVRLLSGCVVCV